MTETMLIAGAGIGGLTAALALQARGIGSTVIESAPELRPLGVGINLLPHAVRELYALGLGEELSRVAVAPAAISYYDTDGELLFREPRGIEGGYGFPQYSVHRGQLQMLLLSALRDRVGPDAVRAGAKVTGFVPSGDRVAVQTCAGALVADTLIGADGIHSAARPAASRTDPVLEYPMVDRDVLPWWGRGRVTLLGDAAHPMYPVGANGGSQAIVDAQVLAEELARVTGKYRRDARADS